MVPIPVPWRSKVPHVKDWQHLRPTLADLDALFPPGVTLNVGLILGAPSGGLIDVDLDAPEAVAAAPLLLPATGWVSGRPNKPASHWWYHVSDPPAKATTKFLDLDDARACLLEVRSTGGQTVVPPSQHPSHESLLWHTFTRPAAVALDELMAAAHTVASVALLARHWPGRGSRQEAFLALAGGLLRAGWSPARVERAVTALVKVTADEEGHKRIQTVSETRQKLDHHQPTTGWAALAALLGARGTDVVRTVCTWLALPTAPWPDPVPFSEVPAVLPFPLDVFPHLRQDTMGSSG